MSRITKGMRVTTTQKHCSLFPGDIVPAGDFVVGRDEDTNGTVYLYRWGKSSGGFQVRASSCTPVPTLITAGMWVTTTQKSCNMVPSDVLPTGPVQVVRGQSVGAKPGSHAEATIMVGSSKWGERAYNIDVSSCTVVPEPAFFGVDRDVAKGPAPWKLAGVEPKKGWTFNVPLDEVDGMRILRELDEAGAKYASLKQNSRQEVVIVHADILKEFPGLKLDTLGPISKVDIHLGTYDGERHGLPTKWHCVSKYGAHETFEKLKAAIEGARKAKREASKVRVTVEYGV